MLIAVFFISVGLTFLGLRWHHQRTIEQAARALTNARESGVEMDTEGNIDAESTFASLSRKEALTGERFTGKKARFMMLMRIVAEGPKSPDEIRFLFEEGIEPVVRPDGLIYVPCIENEHLAVDGDLTFKEEDLDWYIEQGHLEKLSA